MDRSRMAEECGSHVIFALVVLLAVVQRAQGLAVSRSLFVFLRAPDVYPGRIPQHPQAAYFLGFDHNTPTPCPSPVSGHVAPRCRSPVRFKATNYTSSGNLGFNKSIQPCAMFVALRYLAE
ncbi:hypothetical protein LSH36_939g00033 [Paralvinella palmiformis]|uniref:Secreted protein n=1 Tax=Paralvinella palmiformis TaxID=53620 RepID=A0AAD9IXU8_9ANNE|nr:hypothetical protein LSH36_939g00033 [Paralvinella palmiformis]